LEGHRDRWGLFLDTIHAKLSVDGRSALVRADVDVELAIVELGGFYRLREGSWSADAEPGLNRVTFDVLGGGRYYHVDTDIDIKGLGPFGVRIKVDDDEDWVDPIIGLRARADLTQKLFLKLRGDIGGFGISDSSDVSTQLLAAFGYQLNERWVILAGYRYLGVDYQDGGFLLDVDISGPILGVAFTF